MAGLVDFTKEEEVTEYLENIEVEYMYGCNRERNEDSCTRLGEFLETIKKRFVESAKVYKDCCDTWKSAPCCYKLGNYHMLGRGLVEKSEEKALHYYSIACAQDTYIDHGKNDRIAAACCSKASILYKNKEVREKYLQKISKDETQSDKQTLFYNELINSYQRACSLKDQLGCNVLSVLYMNDFEGRPNTKNLKLAAKYAEMGCDLGNAVACHNIHLMYRRGDGVDKNLTKSKEFAERRDEIHQGAESLSFGA